MNNLKIVINQHSIMQRNGLITGEIYIKFDKIIFPEIRWNDFIVTVLSTWAQNAIEIMQHFDPTCDFNFMDGPMVFRVVKKENNIMTLNLIIRQKTEEKIIYSCECKIVAFIKELIKAINGVLLVINKNGWRSKDIDELSKVTKTLKSIMNR